VEPAAVFILVPPFCALAHTGSRDTRYFYASRAHVTSVSVADSLRASSRYEPPTDSQTARGRSRRWPTGAGLDAVGDPHPRQVEAEAAAGHSHRHDHQPARRAPQARVQVAPAPEHPDRVVPALDPAGARRDAEAPDDLGRALPPQAPEGDVGRALAVGVAVALARFEANSDPFFVSVTAAALASAVATRPARRAEARTTPILLLITSFLFRGGGESRPSSLLSRVLLPARVAGDAEGAGRDVDAAGAARVRLYVQVSAAGVDTYSPGPAV
jgi:hypothetical protein